MESEQTDSVPELVLVTGVSGAGRSSVAKVLEDMQYLVIDNLPPQLIPAVADYHGVKDGRRLALVIDSRAGLHVAEVKNALEELESSGIRKLIVFLDADDFSIIRRYEENRRPHPVEAATLRESIARERQLLADLRESADLVIDTSELNVHQLRQQVAEQFGNMSGGRSMRVSITSFGFKHGIPLDVDLIFDVRFLPNPYWIPQLRSLRGTDKEVAEYVFESDDAQEFFGMLTEMITFLIPRYRAEGKSFLSVGIGCTGGHHRSIAIAEKLGEVLGEENHVVVRHRDSSL